MRDILFRGKESGNNKWVYGFYSKHDGETYIEDETKKHSVYSYTVGQYTGLQDKNGAKIFEGDIVKFEYPSRDVMGIYVVNGIFSFTGVVVFEDGYFALKKKRNNLGYDYLQLYQARAHRDYHDGVIEIIGNIHDNPELLEVK